MHYPNAWTCVRPFASRPDIKDKELFYLRVIKRHFDLWMTHPSDDDFFLHVIDAAFTSNGSGPLPYGPVIGIPLPFVELYEEETKYVYAGSKGQRAKGFFFDRPYNEQDISVRNMGHLILHIPHSSTRFLSLQGNEVHSRLRKDRDLIDWYTDLLFSPDEWEKNITPVVFSLCRTECDVERMIDDPLEELGLGIHEREKEYLEHHHKMEDLILSCSYGVMVIDCHSFSSRPTVLLPDKKLAAEYDICIGFNDDKTRPDDLMIGIIVDYFEFLGYRVGVNTPFSNSKTFNVPCEYKSIMIEVNKRLYMDEDTLEKTEGFKILHGQILDLYKKLVR